MRSMAFKAVLAAFLVSAPLATAFARDHNSGGSHAGNFSQSKGLSDGDNTDSSAPIYGQQQGGPLNYILGELRSDDARINADRQMKLITAAEAHGLRSEDAMLRRAAERDAAGTGFIPAGEYGQVSKEVNALGMQINRDAGQR